MTNRSRIGKLVLNIILDFKLRSMCRLDIKYASLNLIMGDKVCFAPVVDPQQILDIGTGTGIWAIDAAEDYPGATGTFSLSRPHVSSLG
jgi:ribosomal protein RSM22 (predicted rRNA methylase)